MIKNIISNPSLRLFCIGRESYIIFTGNTVTDKRPFIRIGDMRAIPAEVHPHIDGIILTHDMLGNPLQEKEYLSLPKTKRPYVLGVPEVILRYKHFLGLDKVLSAKYERTGGSASTEKGVLLYYTDLDQVEVYTDATRIFSLRKRAAQDMHFHQRNELIARTFQQYAGAYGSSALSQSGFFVINATPYFYNNGKIFAIDPPQSYYVDLATHSFDPRLLVSGAHSKLGYSFLSVISNRTFKFPLLRWHFYDLPDDIDDDAVTRFVQFAQMSMRTQIFRNAIRIPFVDSMIEKKDHEEHFSMHNKAGVCFTLDMGNAMWSITHKGHTSRGTIIPNLPYRVVHENIPSASALLSTYLPRSFESNRNQHSASESALLNAWVRFLDAHTVHVRTTSYQRIVNSTKKLARVTQPRILYALHNCFSVLKVQLFAAKESGALAPLLQNAHTQLEKTIAQITKEIGMRHTPYPHAQVVLQKTATGFVQLVEYNWNTDAHDEVHETQIKDKIISIDQESNSAFYKKEQARLLMLCAEINNKTPEVDASATSEMAAPAVSGAPALSERDIMSRNAIPQLKRRPIRNARVLVTISVLLLLVGALLFWLLSTLASGTDSVADVADSADATELEVQSNDTITQHTARIEDGAFTEEDFSISPPNLNATLFSDAYFSIQSPLGTVVVTLEEIVRLVNLIAQQNGFRQIGVDDLGVGNDPDLIYPFDLLVLPPSSEKYEIVANDSIWQVAISLINNQIVDFLSQLAVINTIIEEESLTVAEEQSLLRTIDEIIAASYSESLDDIAYSVRQKR